MKLAIVLHHGCLLFIILKIFLYLQLCQIGRRLPSSPLSWDRLDRLGPLKQDTSSWIFGGSEMGNQEWKNWWNYSGLLLLTCHLIRQSCWVWGRGCKKPSTLIFMAYRWKMIRDVLSIGLQAVASHLGDCWMSWYAQEFLKLAYLMYGDWLRRRIH